MNGLGIDNTLNTIDLDVRGNREGLGITAIAIALLRRRGVLPTCL